MYIPNYKYMFVYIYILYFFILEQVPSLFRALEYIAARPAWSPQQGDGCVRLDERDVGRWGDQWGSLGHWPVKW